MMRGRWPAISSSSRKPNVDQTSGSTDSQKANGVELALALSGDDYRVDIGSTPLGGILIP